MRIIVTGGLGFIGSNFVNLLNEKLPEVEVVILDKVTYAADPNNIIKTNKLIKKDICDVTPEDLGVYDYIVHFAAESHVDNSISNGRPFLDTNIMGTFNLVECARQNKSLKKFIHISTDEVYGDMWDRLVLNKSAKEDHNLNPSSYYSSTKASSDMIVMSAHRTYGLPYLVTRTCNNYGENQNKEKFLPKIFNSILNDKIVPVYGDGKQEREWMYVKDNVKVIYDLMLDEEVVNEVYNIGTDMIYKNINLIEEISNILDKEVKFDFVKDRLGHDKKYRLSSLKLLNYYERKGVEYKPTEITEWFKGFLIKE
jgi:dTDP-glucose 4,6-dehydratase|tara:strand:+ start:2474 stop:3406 length:933 start_codon:yes stop_codon:yes gene_type:complete